MKLKTKRKTFTEKKRLKGGGGLCKTRFDNAQSVREEQGYTTRLYL